METEKGSGCGIKLRCKEIRYTMRQLLQAQAKKGTYQVPNTAKYYLPFGIDRTRKYPDLLNL